jgi:murein DD-endopeptidase MepM/ murein hydrolase activator NlpD
MSMLAGVVGVEWGAPGVLARVRGALNPAAIPDAVATRPAAAPGVPVVDVVPAGSTREVPVPGVAPVDVPAGPVAAAGGAMGLLIPVQGVTAANLVDTYEHSRGQGRRHDAIDIMAPRGIPVVAVADGVVMKLFNSVRGGITLYHLAPDRRTIYYYAHLDRYAPGIAEGQPLRRGQVLGYVGNTGDAGPGNYHLHFEVSTTADPKRYWGGAPQNPYPLLR